MSHRSVSSFCIVQSSRQGHTRGRSGLGDVRHDRWSGSSRGPEPPRRFDGRDAVLCAPFAGYSTEKGVSTTAVSGSIIENDLVNRSLELLPDRSAYFCPERGKPTGGSVPAGSQGRKRPVSGVFPAVSGQGAHAPDRPAPRYGLSGLPRDLGLGNAATPELTLGSESTKTGATRDLGGLLVTCSGRSSLRRATIVLLGCAALGLSAPALAQGPAPEPAPPAPTSPKPEPRSTPPEPPPPARRATQPTPPPPPSPSPPPAPSPPPPAQTSQTFVQQPPPPAPTPTAPVRRARTPVQEPPATKTPKKKRVIPSKQTQKPVLTRVRATVADSPDTMLLVGGFALFVLVLGDTIFLTLSARFLREAGG